MAKITRIKANDSPSRKEESDEPAITRKKVIVKDKKSEKTTRKEIKNAEKEISVGERNVKEKKPFILIRPIVYLGRYLRDAWRELRQVRWPNRKTTWKMVLAVIVYTAIFVVFISILDLFFSWLFNLILSK